MTQRRFVETRYRTDRSRGRSVVGLVCPFCGVMVEAYCWSLAGSGKRCECGALLGVAHGMKVASK